jgi:hypothetical protein
VQNLVCSVPIDRNPAEHLPINPSAIYLSRSRNAVEITAPIGLVAFLLEGTLFLGTAQQVSEEFLALLMFYGRHEVGL